MLCKKLVLICSKDLSLVLKNERKIPGQTYMSVICVVSEGAGWSPRIVNLVKRRREDRRTGGQEDRPQGEG